MWNNLQLILTKDGFVFKTEIQSETFKTDIYLQSIFWCKPFFKTIMYILSDNALKVKMVWRLTTSFSDKSYVQLHDIISNQNIDCANAIQ